VRQQSGSGDDEAARNCKWLEADHAGRMAVEVINRQFRAAGGSYEEYGAAVKAAVAHGGITLHPSGGYLSFTQAGADLFA
jgi:hypothetical protein